MRVLLLGCISSTWTMSFVQEFLLKYKYEVWVLNTSIKQEYRQFFEKEGIHIIECPPKVMDWYERGKKGGPLKTLYIYLLQFNSVIKEGHYDIINLHFVEWFELISAVLLKIIKKSKLVLSYWGSDLLRIDDKILLVEGTLVRCADYVTFDNGDLKIKFEKLYKWSDRIKNETVMFGLPILEIINEKRRDEKSEIRKKFGIPINKKVIAIGYNGILEQRHLEVLKYIDSLGINFKNCIFLLLHMSYGGTEEYRREVALATQKTGCECLIIENFLSDEEVADLRIVTDIFINAQTTDAFSGSVCENLFAGTLVINAAWLRYQEFEKYDFQFSEFDDFDSLPEYICDALQCEYDLSENKKLVWNLRSWECCAPKWERVYREVLS